MHEVLPGEHRDDARHCRGRPYVDPGDARVRVRRAQERGMELARRVDVVGEAPLPLEERFVLHAADGMAAAEAGVTR